MKKGFAPILIIGLVLALSALSFVVYKVYVNPPPQQFRDGLVIETPSPTSSSSDETVYSNEGTANWKTYNGLNFSFKHPSEWKNEPVSESLLKDTTIESKRLRINVAVFDAEYTSVPYNTQLQNFTHREATKLNVQNKNATKFITRGEGHPLPTDYSIITLIVEGKNSSSYLINFNGPNEEINDELIYQILSTFKFTE